MSNFPVTCMIDGLTFKGDEAYLRHMEQAHGSSSPDQAMGVAKAKERNLPKDAPAVVLDKDAPPPDDFMEIAKMMDQPQQAPPPTPPAPQPVEKVVAPVITKATPRPLVLKYRFEGDCPTCNAPIRTIMVNANEKTFAMAYCLTHETVEQREVYPLDERPMTMMLPESDMYEIRRMDNHMEDLFQSTLREGKVKRKKHGN